MLGAGEAINKFNEKPILAASWEDSTPTVRVCKKTNVTRGRVDQAIRFWKSKGWKFGTVIWDDTSEWCTGATVIGSIVILPMDGTEHQKIMGEKLFLTKGVLGMTKRYMYGDLIFGARIFLKEGYEEKQKILEHEFGHALGFKHSGMNGHLMHADYSRTGWNVSGLSKSEANKK